MVLEQRNPDTPVIQTLFSPLSMARFLADDLYVVHLRRNPTRVVRALAALTETCAAFARAAISAGADGIFLSTMATTYDVLSPSEQREIGGPADLAVLEAARSGWLNILHVHGQQPMIREVADYPVHGLSWHDRAAGPSLAEAAALFPGALVAGIEQFSLLNCGTPAEVAAQVTDALMQTGGHRLIVAAGCTYPLTVPECNLVAARQAVEKIASKNR